MQTSIAIASLANRDDNFVSISIGHRLNIHAMCSFQDPNLCRDYETVDDIQYYMGSRASASVTDDDGYSSVHHIDVYDLPNGQSAVFSNQFTVQLAVKSVNKIPSIIMPSIENQYCSPSTSELPMVIYVDPGREREKIYTWFEARKMLVIEPKNIM